jgi:hypothetical protein
MRSPVSLARLALVCAAVFLTSCGASGTPTPGPTPSLGPVPAVLSTDLSVGPNRFLFTLLDGNTGRVVAAPEDEVEVSFFEVARSRTVAAARGTAAFLWADPGRDGAFAIAVELTAAGGWEAEIVRAGSAPSRVSFDVHEASLTPRLGGRAPPSATRTLIQVEGRVEELTSDPNPLPRFYRHSISEAVGAAVPFVVIFGSPAHCSSSGCQHMLDVAKQVASGTSELTFIHVELYRDHASEEPQELDPAVGEWRLPSEPWLFVVNAQGRIAAKYELAVDPTELRAAIEALY